MLLQDEVQTRDSAADTPTIFTTVQVVCHEITFSGLSANDLLRRIEGELIACVVVE